MPCMSRCFPKLMGKPGKEWFTEVLSRTLVAVGISSEGLVGDTHDGLVCQDGGGWMRAPGK